MTNPTAPAKSPTPTVEARCRAESAAWSPARRAVAARLLAQGWPVKLPEDDAAALAVLVAQVSL